MLAVRGLLALLTTALGPFVALLIVIGFFSVADWLTGGNTFFTLQNFRTVAIQACIVAVAALGMTVIVISGGIDLSVGSAVALAATVLAWGIHYDVAVLATTGSSFRTASIRLAQAQAREQVALEDAKSEWQAEADRWREVLRGSPPKNLPRRKQPSKARPTTQCCVMTSGDYERK